MTLHVRQYEPTDAQRCCDVINDAIGTMDGLNEAARSHVRSRNKPERLGADLTGWHSMIIETSDGRIVGVGALDRDEIKRVYVDPVAHGRGAATVLMAALEAAALDYGITSVRLEASPSSATFYESLGYLRGSDASLKIGEAVFRFVPMTKDL